MATRNVLACVRRGWVIVVLGLLVTGFACLQIHRQAGSYWAQTNVYFLAPADPRNTNTIAYTTDSIIATAGLVAQLVDPTDKGPSTSAATTLVAEGVQDGHRVRLPNSGGQWALNFDTPTLDVQAVGTDPDQVRFVMASLIGDIDRTLAELQTADGVPASDRITTTHTPSEIQIRYASGETRRAYAVAIALGTALTLSAIMLHRRQRGSVEAQNQWQTQQHPTERLLKDGLSMQQGSQ